MDKETPIAPKDRARRKLIGALAAGGGVVGLNAAPSTWRKPSVAAVMLPAHASTSGCLGAIGNCPAQYAFQDGPNTETVGSVKYDAMTDLAGVSGNGNGLLTGSGSTIITTVGTGRFDCYACNGDETGASKYFYKYGSFSFNAGLTRHYATARFRYTAGCGENELVSATATLDGTNTYFSQTSTIINYTGSKYFSLTGCNFLKVP